MGTVWRAYDEMLDRDVAVKEVHLPERITEAERKVLCRRLLGEARATAALKHPGVVAVHDLIVEDGRPWIVMEFLESRSLHRLIADGGPLGVRRAAEIGVEVLSVLRAAHAAGILHRDVKPSNVLICEDGRVLLTDFGLAVHMEQGRETAETLVAGIEGSPAYLPPERVNGHPSVEASDLWSLGATLYTAVEGFSPFLRCHALASMVAVLLGDYADPVRAGALEPVIQGLLRQEPEDRLSAEATAVLLREAAGPSPEPGATALPATAPPARRTRRPAARRAAGRRAAGLPAAGLPAVARRGASRRVPFPSRALVRPAGPARPARPGRRRGGPVRRRAAGLLRGGRPRPGAVLSVVVLAALAAGMGTWAARWTSIGKSDAVALRPAAGVPSRMAKYREAGAYSVRVPAGWQAERRGAVMAWEDWGTGRALRISPAPGEPLAQLRAAEGEAVAQSRYPGYRRLRLEAVPELVDGAAEWEFTWKGDAGGEHVLCSRVAGYEFRFSAPDPQWTPGQRLYDGILKSFRAEKRE
ncbi:serine/threonine protein kinase [Actinomadura graeca]|uniref:non-specific serine/threonine protein kinase n=1 Tax=Actinomadura graeca TaxID=2750812 RepID=A0ABX8QYI4_9ACTN|nr:serine/threonine-protein kinase [Actinomadura graeca]QXJ23239.1 serine/threonine protein kinase [Actinomadura graeca]